MTLDWGHNLPEPDIWLQHDLAVKFWNRANLSCAVALADGDLAEIKHWCRYGIHKNPMPSSVIHLHGNKWLLTNISVLQVHHPDADGLMRAPTHTQYLTELQTVMTFGCHCDYIRADNFRMITDEDYCEVQEDISATVEIKHTVNLAYISSYVSEEQLQHLTAASALNESVKISLPKLDMEGDAWCRDLRGRFVTSKTVSVQLNNLTTFLRFLCILLITIYMYSTKMYETNRRFNDKAVARASHVCTAQLSTQKCFSWLAVSTSTTVQSTLLDCPGHTA